MGCVFRVVLGVWEVIIRKVESCFCFEEFIFCMAGGEKLMSKWCLLWGK